MYIGRFAPSPTGQLHFGSLLAATASFLDARKNNGLWKVRVEDIDPPREIAGASESILQTLIDFGFEWDGEILYQSERYSAYKSALNQLSAQKKIYACICSRRTINNKIYPGTCREKKLLDNNLTQPYALRVCTKNTPICFQDTTQGTYTQNILSESGDFKVLRNDGLYCYHLAVTVDDAYQNITHVIRGFDLLDSTPKHIYLQKLLQLPTPVYAHIPIAINQAGDKLSKQTRAEPVSAVHATTLLWQALKFLGQEPPNKLRNCKLTTLWDWAVENWVLEKIPKQQQISY